MRFFSILLSILFIYSCNKSNSHDFQIADNKVVAHRGAWKTKNLPENSIASLEEAFRLNCTGSEFDVRMTSDEVLIVNHDKEYHGLPIEESTYQELSKYKLSNGEQLPTLQDFITSVMNHSTSTGLVLEIKPSPNGRNELIAQNIIKLIREMKAERYISYIISFSYAALLEVERIYPEAKTLYLDGSKSPQQLKSDNIDGLDYIIHKLRKNPKWIQDAKELGLLLIAWNVKTPEQIDWLIANEFDYITSDNPEEVFDRLLKSPVADGYKLVWSDEFNYKGAPDSTKWDHEIGFKRNQEKQYYTDKLTNARVEKGHLILESHKESVINESFSSSSDKNWRKNQKSAQYSAASLTTKDLAEWKYGRIDIRAKLPKGVGLWPAFWMLGANYDEVKWPECGEIDIMEHVGFDPDSIFATIHTKAYNHMKNTQKGKKTFIDKPYDSFHVYSVIWTPENMEFLLDDEVYNSIENEHISTHEWPFDQKFHLKINVAIGGMLGGRKGIDDDSFPNQMVVDFVRVFQKK